MKLLKRQTKKPAKGYSAFLHVVLVAIIPILAFVLIRLDFAWLAVTLVLLSKWRMFAVKARHWPAIIRANSVDIFAGLSFVVFMASTQVISLQLMWVVFYALWLLVIKPQSGALWVGVQALLSQMLSLIAIFYYFSESSTILLVVTTWGVTYLCARHFLSAFDEGMSRGTSYAWAFFAASIAWLSGHWLILYGPIAQPALLISVLAYGLAAMYYLEHTDRLTKNIRRQFIAVMFMVVIFLIVFSEWSDKTV
jgi:hypothetical protein